MGLLQNVMALNAIILKILPLLVFLIIGVDLECTIEFWLAIALCWFSSHFFTLNDGIRGKLPRFANKQQQGPPTKCVSIDNEFGRERRDWKDWDEGGDRRRLFIKMPRLWTWRRSSTWLRCQWTYHWWSRGRCVVVAHQGISPLSGLSEDQEEIFACWAVLGRNCIRSKRFVWWPLHRGTTSRKIRSLCFSERPRAAWARNIFYLTKKNFIQSSRLDRLPSKILTHTYRSTPSFSTISSSCQSLKNRMN